MSCRDHRYVLGKVDFNGDGSRMARLPSFAVLYYGEPLCDDDVMIPEVMARFSTFDAAEAYRVRRFGSDNENATVMED